MDALIYIIGFACAVIFLVGLVKTIGLKTIYDKILEFFTVSFVILLALVSIVFIFWIASIISPTEALGIIVAMAALKFLAQNDANDHQIR